MKKIKKKYLSDYITKIIIYGIFMGDYKGTIDLGRNIFYWKLSVKTVKHGGKTIKDINLY